MKRQAFVLFILLTGFSIFAGFLIRILFPFNLHDGDFIGSLAAKFAEDFNFGGSMRRAPVYPFLLGLFYMIFGTYHPFALIFLHSIFVGLIGGLISIISYKLYQSERKAMIIGFLTAANPIILWYLPRFYVEIVFLYFFMLSVWYGFRSYTENRFKDYLLFGLFTGLACLTKAVMLLFPLYLGMALALAKLISPANSFTAFKSYGSFLKTLLISSVVMALTIFPWTIRNKIVSGKWIIISTNTGVEFFRGNSYAIDNSYEIGGGLGGDLFANAMKREDKIIQDHGVKNFQRTDHINHELDSIFNPLMKDFIIHSPGKFGIKVVKQIPPFWYLGKDYKFSLMRLIIATLVLTLFTWVVIKKPDGFNYTIILTIIYLNLIYAAIIAVGRYSIPLYPLMLIPLLNYFIDLLPAPLRKKILME